MHLVSDIYLRTLVNFNVNCGKVFKKIGYHNCFLVFFCSLGMSIYFSGGGEESETFQSNILLNSKAKIVDIEWIIDYGWWIMYKGLWIMNNGEWIFVNNV